MRGHPSSFVALVVEPLSIDGAPWLADATSALPPRVRALHPADVHLTLAFFGGVDPERALLGFEAAARRGIAAMRVQLGEVIPMGAPDRWTALSATLDEGRDRAAAAMLAVRDEATDAAGVARETRPPLPHVTLARLHEKATAAEREGALAWAASLSLAHRSVLLALGELALYTGRRHRTPGEPAYDLVRRLPLR